MNMTDELNLGVINGHAVGRILKEAVRRSMVGIKEGYSGEMNDVLTSADTLAQEIYLRTLRECFPDCGIIAEEDSLSILPKNGATAYFTVDPLDGTKAFVRRQSHGVGTMVALVDNGVVLSAYIGDINTQEVYGYRPGSKRVYRITHLDTFEELLHTSPFIPRKGYTLLREALHTHSPLAQEFILERSGDHLIDGGSIGIWLARLWKREVGAVILPPSFETPWDSTPVVGISEKLGYQFFRPSSCGTKWELYIPTLCREKYKRDHETLIVHRKDVEALKL
jgi:fructose-1,6-bisphosphatase/inositol monophosphatase family enzyme